MTARDAALRALLACRKDGAWSDGALKRLLTDTEPREAALASRLCYGVLQNRLLLDHWLKPFARGKLQPAVEEILRLAVYQITFLDKIPPSAAVNEAVGQAKRFANPAAARLVNGVLRSFLRAGTPKLPEDLSLRYSHPEELTALLQAQYGDRTERLLQSHNEAPATVLQVNTLRTTTARVAQALTEVGADWQAHPWLPDCLTVRGAGDLERLDVFRDGLCYVQDAAARLAVWAAELQPGQRVLDCCAAPGGKSFAAAIAMRDRGEIVSCDIHPHKLRLIERGAQRLGIGCITTRLQNAAEPVTEWENAFDTVLCDAPCSGLGVIRKKPDIRYKDLIQTEPLPALQAAILDNQSRYVRAGGLLIYSTCTILRRENEAVVEAFLRKHSEFVPEAAVYPEGAGLPAAAMTTLLPCDHGTDGFFVAKLRKKG